MSNKSIKYLDNDGNVVGKESAKFVLMRFKYYLYLLQIKKLYKQLQQTKRNKIKKKIMKRIKKLNIKYNEVQK